MAKFLVAAYGTHGNVAIYAYSGDLSVAKDFLAEEGIPVQVDQLVSRSVRDARQEYKRRPDARPLHRRTLRLRHFEAYKGGVPA